MTEESFKTPSSLPREIVKAFGESPEFIRARELLFTPGSSAVCGQAIGSSKSLLIAEIAKSTDRPILVIVPEQSDAYLMLDDLEFLVQGSDRKIPVFVFPHLEILPYESQVPELTIRMERLAPIQFYLENQIKKAADQPAAWIVISPISAILKRLPPLSFYERQSLRCRVGQEMQREATAEWLVKEGYEFRELVAQRGDFSIRGDIIDIYSFSYPEPIRIELWGDEVDSIRLFDISTQRSSCTIPEVVIYPGNEDVLLAEALQKPEPLELLPDLLGLETLLFLVEYETVEREGANFYTLVEKRYREVIPGQAEDHEVHLGEEDFHKQQKVILEPPDTLYCSYSELEQRIAPRSTLRLTEFILEPEEHHENLGCGSPQIFGEDKKERIQSLTRFCTIGQQVLIVCDNPGQQSRLDEILQSQQQEMQITGAALFPQTLVGGLHRGFFLRAQNVLICTDREIYGRYRRFRTPEREGIALPVLDLMDLQPGDFVVHIDHGIGRFTAMRKMEHEGKEGEYLELHYADNGILYVPIEQIDRVGRYIGSDTAPPSLAKLGTKNWERSKARARQAIEDMAEELLDLYAVRTIHKGHAFAKDSPWQHEFEASFLYEETPDQWRAIEEVKRDMENSEPMDRLICGDVGFGKTEVAIRAAFKSVMDGKQVAILAPTTVLCQQHFNTFRDRLADYPVRVEMLSRFIDPSDQKIVVQKIHDHETDIVIGTHRLLSMDVRFAELGLVIIDEEQRFGVKHKERLRQLRKLVDTLTLTATPIPRTLYMSLSGIRNMSLVSTPPKNRLPIETYIMEWSKEVVENAILRELSRDGQVYFVHNRVESILSIADYVQNLVPQARVCVGHGQMSEHELERVMMNFIRHEYDILVATTIIENGLDIPNVNTIIINDADHFGLSQLYQLRGRVGRDRHRAYCYLIVPNKRALSSIARRRLLALQEHNQLGAGFQIAMQDMEIRGIGNILGREQHGHIAAIGFDLYTKLLGDTIHKLKRKTGLAQEWDTFLEISPKGSFPPSYIESSHQRMALHQRIAKIKTPEEIQNLRDELLDIYGKIPESVELLLRGLQIRIRAHAAGLDYLQVGKNQGCLSYHPSQSHRLNPLRVIQLDGKNGFKLRVSTKGEHLLVQIEDTQKRNSLADQIISLMEELEKEPELQAQPTIPFAPAAERFDKKKIKTAKPLRKFY